MNRGSRFLSMACLMFLAAAPPSVEASAAAPANYEALVQKGNSKLQAGSNDEALASAKAAISMNPSRWEGYALEGGALVNLGRCSEAQAALLEAIKRAPDAKLSGLQTLLRQCQGSAPAPADNSTSSRQPSPTPSYEQTVAYISDKVRQAGEPGKTKTHVSATIVEDGMRFAITVQSCDNMTVTQTNHMHYDDPNDHQFPHSEGLETHTRVVPFSAVGWITASNGTVSVVTNAGRVTGSEVYTFTNPEDNNSDTFTSTPGQAVPLIAFHLPGTESMSEHVAKAVEHLVDLCVNHAEQAPKEAF